MFLSTVIVTVAMCFFATDAANVYIVGGEVANQAGISPTNYAALMADTLPAVMHGVLARKATDKVTKWDTATNSFTTMASMPAVKAGHTVVHHNGYIYAIAGTTGVYSSAPNSIQGVPQQSMFIYDIAANTWTTGPSTLYNHTWVTGTVLNDKIYLCDGQNTIYVASNLCEVLDSTATPLQWVAIASHPMAPSYPGYSGSYGSTMFTANGEVYSPQGLSYYSNGTVVFKYDAATDSWSQMSGQGPYHYNMALAVNGNDAWICASNGAVSSTQQPQCEKYNVVANTWTSIGNMPSNVGAWGRMINVAGDMYVFGGGQYQLNQYIAKYNVGTNTWASLPGNVKLPYPMFNMGAVVV